MCNRLDDYVAKAALERVSVIKIDAEGSELAILKGAMDTLRRFSPALLLECEDRHLSRYGVSVSDVVRLLTSCGYERKHQLHGLTHFVKS
jgi:hypothetical protein